MYFTHVLLSSFEFAGPSLDLPSLSPTRISPRVPSRVGSLSVVDASRGSLKSKEYLGSYRRYEEHS